MTPSVLIDLVAVVAIILLGVGCVLLVKWIGAVADLIWMIAVRARLTGAVLGIVGVAVVVAAVIIGVPPFTMMLLVGLFVPLAARRVCDLWAVRETRKDGLMSEQSPKSLFEVERLRQRDRYEAPMVDRRL